MQNYNFTTKDYNFLINVFLVALLVRVAVAALIVAFDLQDPLGPDAIYYDQVGDLLTKSWMEEDTDPLAIQYASSGWGMKFFVGIVYLFLGRNPLAAQLIVATLGAATCVIGYFCAREIFQNRRVAQYTALFIGFFPAMIIWTSQLLKDGLIIFFLILAFWAGLILQKKLTTLWMIVLLVSLGAISSLRFYIFFMLLAAIAGSFVLNIKTEAANIASRFIACVIIGLAFSYLGVWQMSGDQIGKYVNLERIQMGREYAGKQGSGFVDNVDVTTTEGFITAIPIGLATLYLAPFPWQVQNLTQVMTMPEMIVWWIGLPFIFIGVSYSIRHKLGGSMSILFFSLLLSLSYALYQGNLGTLYRQRAQLQIFLLIFAAVGFVVYLEKKENKNLLKKKRQLNPANVKNLGY